MKKIILSFCLVVFSVLSYAQINFENSIKTNAAKLEKATTVQEYDNLFFEFSKLVRTESNNRWKAYYYAGLSQYKKAELLISSNEFAAAIDAHAIAYKYVSGGIPSDNAQGKKLMALLDNQKNRLFVGNKK